MIEILLTLFFCPVLCIAEMPVLKAFGVIRHFGWYRRIASNELQMVYIWCKKSKKKGESDLCENEIIQ